MENDDVSEEVFEGRIEEEVKLRKRIDDARSEGKLLDQSQPSGWSAYTLKRPFEPPRTLAHRDYFLSQALHYSKLAAEERRNHIVKSKKIAAMIQLHFKRLSGADEKERKLQEKRIRQIAKRTAQEVKRKWRLAEKVCLKSSIIIARYSNRFLKGCSPKTCCTIT